MLLATAIGISALLLESAEAAGGGLAFLAFFTGSGWVLSSHVPLPPFPGGRSLRMAIYFLLGVAVYLAFYLAAQFFLPGTAVILLFGIAMAILAIRRHCSGASCKGVPNLSPCAPGLSLAESKSGTALLLLFIAFAFLVSASIVWTPSGVYLKDPLHGTYEVSIAQSSEHPLNAYDLSYAGKPLKYNFGAPILLRALQATFGMDGLVAAYRFFPLLSGALFIILFYHALGHFSNRPLVALGMTTGLLVGSLLLFPIESRLGSPTINMLRLTYMASFGLVANFLIVFYWAIFPDSRTRPAAAIIQTSLLASVLLLAIAITKSAVAVPLLLSIGTVAVLRSIRSRRPGPLAAAVPLVAPGLAYIALFVAGAHLQSLWVPFPGFFRLASPAPDGIAFYLFPAVSLAVSLAALCGILSPLVLSRSLSFLSMAIRTIRNALSRSPSVVADPAELQADGILFFSIGLALFAVDVVELNNFQFALPGVFLGALLFSRNLSRHAWVQRRPALIILVALASAAMYIVLVHVAPYVLPLPPEPINPVSDAYLRFSGAVAPLKLLAKGQLGGDGCAGTLSLPQWFFYKAELLHALQYLERHTPADAVVVWGRHYEFNPPQGCAPPWAPIDFLRTAAGGRTTVVENHGSKGILMQPDYFNRTADTIRLYHIVTDPSTRSPRWERLFSAIPRTAYPGYYAYFSIYRKDNFFYRKDMFERRLNESETELLSDPTPANRTDFVREYIDRYRVRYILFEENERPAPWFMEAFRPEPVFSEGPVSVYHIP